MGNNKKEIEAYLIRKKNGNLVKIPGTIVSVNESQKTADMRFVKNDGSETIMKNISQKQIFVNEDFRDDLRNFGQKIGDTAKKVGGAIKDFFKTALVRFKKFLLPELEDGKLDGQGLAAFVNVAACDAPEGVAFYASKGLQQANPSIPKEKIENVLDNYLIDAFNLNGNLTESVKKHKYVNEDIEEIHKFWYGYMDFIAEKKNRGKSLLECMHMWKNKYMPINETVASLKSYDGVEGLPNVNTKELMSNIETNIAQQRTNKPGEAKETVKPLLVWGAPGIGKTAIIRKAGDFVAKSQTNGAGLSMCVINAASIMPDTFQLPALVPEVIGEDKKRLVNIPTSWLPVYEPSNKPAPGFDPEDGITMTDYLDFYYNTGALPSMQAGKVEIISSGKDFNDGGILFIDELSRIRPGSNNILMSILQDRAFDGKVLASHWSMIGAANRRTDMEGESRENFTWETAYKTRFTQVNYVPTKSEWLEWATSKNENGEPNVDPIITDFLSSENVGDDVWFDALDFGSRERDVDRLGQKYNPADDEDLTNAQTLLDEPRLANKLQSWNPRTWTSISNMYRYQLKYLLGEINPKDENDIFQTPIAKALRKKNPNIFSKNESLTAEVRNSLNEAKDEDPATGAIDPTKMTSNSQYKPSLDELKARWQHFYDLNYEKCDPGMDYKEYNETNVKMFLRKWVENVLIPMHHGVNTITQDKFNEYNSYLNVFTAEQYRNIWNYGTMMLPDPNNEGYNIDDYKAPSAKYYQRTNDVKWKSNVHLITEVANLIKSHYPGSMDKDFINSLEMSLSYEGKPLSETLVSEDVFNKWVDFFNFEIVPVNDSGTPNKRSKAKKYNILYFANDGNLAEEGAYSMFVQAAQNKPGKDAEFFKHCTEYAMNMSEDGKRFHAEDKDEKGHVSSINEDAYIKVYTFNNMIDMLERGDKFLLHMLNYIKYMSKVILEFGRSGNRRMIEFDIIGNTDEVFAKSAFADDFKPGKVKNYDYESISNNLFNSLLGSNDEVYLKTLHNSFMMYVLAFKLVLSSPSFIFDEEGAKDEE